MQATLQRTGTAMTSPVEHRRPEGAVTPGRRLYLRLLTWAFTLFSSIRLVAYVPTLWAIHASGDSSQHSLLTWVTWAGANLTMAAWLYEQGEQRLNRAIVVNLGNSTMCTAASVLIVWYRL